MTSNPIALTGLVICLTAFVALMIARRISAGFAATESQAPTRRDPWSWVGIILQGAAFFLVSNRPQRPAHLDFSAAQWLGALAPIALGVACVLIFYFATREMGRNWSVVARMRADHELVTTGPFALVRHPIYLSLVLLLVGFALGFGSAGALLYALPIYIIATLMRTQSEERLLRAQFGAAYEAYAARVKRFIPGLI